MFFTPDISFEELIHHDIAYRHKLNNNPGTDGPIFEALKALAINILLPIKNRYKQPIIILSGYRSQEINNRIGALDSSQHLLGQAIDFKVHALSHQTVVTWISKELDYDHLKIEYANPQIHGSGWIHCSYVSKSLNRNLYGA